MASDIKETPILRGEDAKRFLAAIENPKPVSCERVQEIRDADRQFRQIQINTLFKKWCKETGRNGGVLVGSSIAEWSLYLIENI